MASVYFDFTHNSWYRLDVDTDFLQGQAPAEVINILWTATPAGGASGFPNSFAGGTTNLPTPFEWTPATGNPGTVSFTVVLQGATTNTVYGQKTIGPIQVGGPNTDSWSGTN